jgi:hypothetical protein
MVFIVRVPWALWIYYAVIVVILIFLPFWLPGEKTVVKSYAKHPYELVLYIILCIVLLIPISYIGYIVSRSEKISLRMLSFLTPFSALTLGLLPFIFFYYGKAWIICILIIALLFAIGAIFSAFLMKWG